MTQQSKDNHLSEKDLSLYLDNNVTVKRREFIEQHLQTCEACQQRYRQFQLIQQATRKQPTPETDRGIWRDIRNDIESGRKERESSNAKLHKTAAALLILLLVTAGGIATYEYMNSPTSPPPAAKQVNQFAFDYGLYLTGLEEPSWLRTFVKGYNRTPITMKEAFSKYSSQYSLDLYKELPGNAKVDSVFTLESACCHCLQFVIRSNNKRITVFQQPQKHPAEFTGFQRKHTKKDSLNFITVNAGKYSAFSIKAGNSRYVMVGKHNDPIMTAFLKKVSKQ